MILTLRSALRKARSISNSPQPSGKASAVSPGKRMKNGLPSIALALVLVLANGARRGDSSRPASRAECDYLNRIFRLMSASVPRGQRSPQPA